jgi:two-component system, OmpR family, sensor histidine kinase VanS
MPSYGFRSKMILLFGLSMVLFGTITYIIFKLLQYYHHTWVDYGDPLTHFRSFMYNIGDINFFLLIFIPLSILFFFLLTKRYSTYFNEISRGIHFLALGDFQQQVEIQSIIINRRIKGGL